MHRTILRNHTSFISSYNSFFTTTSSSSTTNAMKVVFCGEHMVAGFRYTRELMHLVAPDVQVIQCRRDDIAQQARDADVIVPLMSRIDRTVIQNSRRLKLINQFGVGIEGVDVDAAREAGVPVANIRSRSSGNAQSCAEHAIYLCLSLLRDSAGMKRALDSGGLGTPVGRTLYKATVLIFGYGDLGKYLSSRLRGFEVRRIKAIGRKQWLDDIEGIGSVDEYGQANDLAAMGADVDVLFICAAQNADNIGIVNASFLSLLKPGCLIVNIARGGLLNYPDVEAALISGHIGGLGMDVYRVEPFAVADSIFALPNVVATPHVAGVTEVAYRTMAKLLCDNILRVRNGEEPIGVVN